MRNAKQVSNLINYTRALATRVSPSPWLYSLRPDYRIGNDASATVVKVRKTRRTKKKELAVSNPSMALTVYGKPVTESAMFTFQPHYLFSLISELQNRRPVFSVQPQPHFLGSLILANMNRPRAIATLPEPTMESSALVPFYRQPQTTEAEQVTAIDPSMALTTYGQVQLADAPREAFEGELVADLGYHQAFEPAFLNASTIDAGFMAYYYAQSFNFHDYWWLPVLAGVSYLIAQHEETTRAPTPSEPPRVEILPDDEPLNSLPSSIKADTRTTTAENNSTTPTVVPAIVIPTISKEALQQVVDQYKSERGFFRRHGFFARRMTKTMQDLENLATSKDSITAEDLETVFKDRDARHSFNRHSGIQSTFQFFHSPGDVTGQKKLSATDRSIVTLKGMFVNQ